MNRSSLATCSCTVTGLLAVMMVGCSDSASAPVEPGKSCDPDTLEASTFAMCTCKGAPNDEGPGEFGCATPRTLYNGVCMIDSSCNVYAQDLDDPLAINTRRADVAFRWEWAEPLPKDANVSLNMPEPGGSALLVPFALFAHENPSAGEYPYDFQDHPEPEKGQVFVSDDRRSVTIVPERGCFDGRWFLQTTINLTRIYGKNICGEPENVELGYTANFNVE